MLAFLNIQGDPFAVGLALGRFGAEAVHGHLLKTGAWASVMRWRDSAAMAAMRQHVQERHPAIVRELEGMAQGLGLSFDEVLAWNCRGDVWAMSPDGCTTVQLPATGDSAEGVFAHNEDGDPGFAGQCAIAQIEVAGGGAFASFVYPGSLPGHTFAVNRSGVAMTVNNLRALHMLPGVPRMVLARAALDQPNVTAVLDLLERSPRSGGFHFTLAQAGHSALTSVEFCADACSVQVLSRPRLHANHMVHDALRHHPQIVTGSSGYRQIRGEEMLEIRSAEGRQPDPLEVLFDKAHAQFPIYRDAPDDSDNENTMATAVMHVNADAVEWCVHVGRSREPLYRLRNAVRT